MTVTTLSKTSLVEGQATAIQAQADGLTDVSLGSVVLADIQATSDVALWLQAIALAILLLTRAQTSKGPDLDSWMAQFGFPRLGAVAATGSVTFARVSATTQVVVPVGSTVETSDGTIQFTVTIDTTNAAYNAGLGGYVMAAATYSVTVPVVCTTIGISGNVIAGAIDVITASIPGVDTVSNASDFENGEASELDPAYLARFVEWLQTLQSGTPAAVIFAALGVATIIQAKNLENETYSGASQPGFFSVIVDDGTGSPSGGALAAVSVAVNGVRPITSTFGVYAPTVVDVTISMTIEVAAGYTETAVQTIVQNALTSYVDGLGDAVSLPWARLGQVAFDASPGVTNVLDVLLNGGTADVSISQIQTVKATSVVVSGA